MSRAWPLLLVMGALALAGLYVELSGERYLWTVLTKIAIYGLAASGLNLVLGVGGLVSFGHAAFLGLGAYVVGILSLHAFEEAPLMGLFASNAALVAWPLAVATGAIAGLLIGLVSLRTGGAYFIMITLAFAQMLYFGFVSAERYGGEDGLSLWWGRNELLGLSLDDRRAFFIVVWLILGGWSVLKLRLMAAPFGRALSASRMNPERLAALGVDVFRLRLVAFAVSAAVTALAGALLANLTGFVSPASLAWPVSGELIVMCVLGGLGTVAGPILGAAALILLEETLVSFTEHWQLFVGLILLAIVLASRRGVSGLLGLRRG
ncbi:MAG: branched-chain amino acid ABC transporter permease [Geminicoccaceae bacterium]|jgi:branched-chain amino acid transport system permease protein|nr:branched-chain amino acid ABC transporter permease [Geminicoccaceae bacterium]MCB9967530.1 branched-chain amino acid ABC transporter permease [Geminicoccaceae bacterium]HRY25013.1 branched-chain amino acid ABC transporter permease [Geminicoccaceae bacterium]